MSIEIVCVGKLKEKYLKQGVEEYLKRLGAYSKVKVVEVADEATIENPSEAQVQQILDKEAQRIHSKIGPGRKVVAMTIEGQLVSSEDCKFWFYFALTSSAMLH